MPIEEEVRSLDSELMARHFLIAAVWANGDWEVGDVGAFPEPTEESVRNAQFYCEQFIKVAGGELQQVFEFPEYWANPGCDGVAEAAIGHDLWLTATGAGVGFSDRYALPKDLRESLSEQAGRFEVLTHRHEQSGDDFHLTAPVVSSNVALNPVCDGPGSASLSRLAAALRDLDMTVAMGDQGSLVVTGLHGLAQFTVTAREEGLNAEMALSDPSIKDWGQLTKEDRLATLDDRRDLIAVLVSAAGKCGLQAQLVHRTGELGAPMKLSVPEQPVNAVDAGVQHQPAKDDGPQGP